MNLTPFDGGLLPEGSNLKKFVNPNMMRGLEMRFGGSPIPNSLISGPMGLGKTTIIQDYFNRERCQTLAREKKILVQPCNFMSNLLSTDLMVLSTLTRAVESSLRNLDRDGEDYRRLSAMFEDAKKNNEESENSKNQDAEPDPEKEYVKSLLLLENLTSILRTEGYSVTLILYRFQQLTCSEACATETFSAMAYLAQQGFISYIVVTDFSIRVGTKNYVLSSFERILPEPLIPDGVTGKKATAALQSAIKSMLASWEEDEDEPIQFTDEEMAELWKLTAGIPGLLQRSLKALYRCRKEEAGALTGERLQCVALASCRDLMRQWTKHLDEPCWDTLKAILDSGRDADITKALPREKERRPELKDSGLIVQNESTQTWRMICPLFELYLREELGRPQSPEKRLVDCVNKVGKGCIGDGGTISVNIFQGDKQNITNVSGGDYLADGATKHEQNVQINAGLISAEEFLNRLGFGDLALGGNSGQPALTKKEKLDNYFRLNQRLHQSAEGAVQMLDTDDEQENDHRLDLLIAQAGQEILPDVDPNTLESGCLMSIERRFADVRAWMKLEEELNDQMMQSLSPLCRFYVEAALVVEDHMESIMSMLQDYSTHLVMYGKCLEQSLRDGLFLLLKTHQDFCDYNTYRHCDTRGDNRTFGAMRSETNAMLGTFYYMLNERKRQLGALCAQCGVTVPGVVDAPMPESDWVQWWQDFAQKVRAAKNIRNRVHAGGVSPTKEDLDDLRRNTFGMDGVLHLSQVGRVLTSKLGIKARPVS